MAAYFCNHQQAGALRVSTGIKQAFNFVRGGNASSPSAILNVGSPASGLGADQWLTFQGAKTDDKLRCSGLPCGALLATLAHRLRYEPHLLIVLHDIL